MLWQQSRIAKEAEKFTLQALVGLFNGASFYRSGPHVISWVLGSYNINGSIFSSGIKMSPLTRLSERK